MTHSEILSLIAREKGFGTKRTGSKSHIACCPAHDDKNPSLVITEGDDGRILLKCHAGCSVESICTALGITITDLFATKELSSTSVQQKRIEYLYRDENGLVLFKKIRIEPGFNGQAKSFYSERFDANGAVVRNLNGCRRVLYRMPELLKAIQDKQVVFLVEGEKDANRLLSDKLMATTSFITSEWSDEFTKVLKDADVVVLYDMDKAGCTRRDLLCEKLFGNVKRLRVVTLPGLEFTESHGKDVTDWLAMGHSVHELVELAKITVDYSPQVVAQKGKVKAISLKDFLIMELPPREMLLAPFLPTQGLGMLYAKRGVGKTHVALGIAYAVAVGGSFFKWFAPVAKKVLYIDGEMPAVSMQERLRIIAGKEAESVLVGDFLQLITPDLQEGSMPDLSTKAGRDSLEPFIKDSSLIIIDNVSTLFRSGSENEAESWQSVQDWALEIRKRGKSVLFVHHAGKTGQQRGTSKREDILDAVINLKHPEGYDASQGAKFEVYFEKARHFTGEEAESFNVELKEQADGVFEWEVSGISIAQDVLQVAEFRKKGMTIDWIMNEMGITKSQVETKIKKAKEKGLLLKKQISDFPIPIDK